MRTIVLGGGFTGLFAALHLARHRMPGEVLLVDREERFTFRPLLYELLTGEMDAAQVNPCFADLLVGSGVDFHQQAVEAIDLPGRSIRLAGGSALSYDHLVLALGSTTGYFGTPGAREHSLPFRGAADVLALVAHLESCLAEACQQSDELKRRRLLQIALVGAGPTGVELAATLADWLPERCRASGLDPREVSLTLLNRSDEILSGNSGQLRGTAMAALASRQAPVGIFTGASVRELTAATIHFDQNGYHKTFSAQTIVWTAGSATHPLIASLAVAPEHRERGGRLKVLPTLQLPEYPEVFAGGDCAVADGHLPATAQVAYQQGSAIATNLKALADNRSPEPASVHLLGTLMRLGNDNGAAEIFDRFEMRGLTASLLRQARYLELLPTPVHNLRATADWLRDEVFERFVSTDNPRALLDEARARHIAACSLPG